MPNELAPDDLESASLPSSLQASTPIRNSVPRDAGLCVRDSAHPFSPFPSDSGAEYPAGVSQTTSSSVPAPQGPATSGRSDGEVEEEPGEPLERIPRSRSHSTINLRESELIRLIAPPWEESCPRLLLVQGRFSACLAGRASPELRASNLFI
jgi:hypothetical protein